MKELSGAKRHNLSLATASPLPDETFGYNPIPRKPTRGRLRAVSLVEVSTVPITIGVGSKEIVNEVLCEAPPPFDVRTSQVIQAALTAQITLSRTSAHRYAPRLLTTEDFIQVKLATVRESTRHCYWPTDVIAKFLRADVIMPYKRHMNSHENSYHRSLG